MPRRKPRLPGSSHLRQSIASAAARLMAEDGIGDYGQAKRKAAKSFGATNSETLPSNEEVEAELRAYQALFQDEEQPERLRELRRTALDVMTFLIDFRPYLTGAVLDGTAGRYAEIEIELYADSAKDVEIFMLSRNISYEHANLRQAGPDAPEARFRVHWLESSVLLSVFPYQAEWRAPRQGGRAKATTVAVLLAGPDP